MSLPSPARTGLRHVSFDDLPAFSRLFRDYCTRYEAVARFYAGDPFSPDARRAAADRAASFSRSREVVADVLREQNEHHGQATLDHVEQLRDPETVAVVTGQQVGLLAGPLYTVFKTITALQLAERLREETGRPVVPVFWVEGEDHDYDEIAGLRLLSRNEVVNVRLDVPRPASGHFGPVGRIAPGDAIDEVVAGIDEALAPSDFKDAVLHAVRDSYQPDVTLEEAFVRFMRTLFPEAGLVFLNPDDARLKRLTAPLFRHELEDPEAPAARVRAASAQLEEAYHAQVNPRPTNLFLLEDDGRLPLDADDGVFRLRGTERTFTRDELLRLLEEDPARFSPNVVLRPLMQDLLVPTAAYVAGPGEIAYFAQYRGVYEWAGIPMPVIYPRASASLVEGKVEKVLDKYSLSVADLAEDLDRFFHRFVVERMDVDVDAVFKEAGKHLHQAVNALKPQVEKVDRSLIKSAEATRVALQKEFDRLKDRVVRAERRQQDEVRAQIEKAQINLYPVGRPQERVLSVLYFLNKYGPDFASRLEEVLSLDTHQHQVVTL